MKFTYTIKQYKKKKLVKNSFFFVFNFILNENYNSRNIINMLFALKSKKIK